MTTVADYMTRFLHSIGPTHSVAAAHRLMQRHQIHHLPIFDDGKLLGVVSERVLYFIESLTNVSGEEIEVRETMEEALSVATTTTVAEAARLMASCRATAVLVMDADEVAGIFTTADALVVLADGFGDA